MNWLTNIFLSFFQALAMQRASEEDKRQAEIDASRKAIREELEAAEARKITAQETRKTEGL